MSNQPNNNNRPRPQGQGQKSNRPSSKPRGARGSSRGQAIRASRRNSDDAHRVVNLYQDASSVKNTHRRANQIDDSPRLKIIGLGGMDATGSKNMIVVEYQNDAIIMDCGNDLGVDLPGVNFGIPDTSYLESIKHKIKAYVITHGHLDHIGGLPYIVPKFPAPVYGSRFTIGMVEQIVKGSDHQVDGFELKTVVMNQDNHERLQIGESFGIEFVRVTHSIPDSTAIVVRTPVGTIINTGDFKIDPDPLDQKPTDTARLEELGREGVLALLSECTNTMRLGRTPTEHVIEPAFHEIISRAEGRVFVACFSTNINRIQMIVNSAAKHGRKIAMDGRSMMSTLETAVRLGMIKIPKGTFVPIAAAANMKGKDLIVVCTGSQGEPNAALQRMAAGEHRHVKMAEQDTVILSSTPIPETGNDAHITRMVDKLMRMGVHVFQHVTQELDGMGPLHVSGHSAIEEYGAMIDMTKPKFFVPIYGSYHAKKRHIDIAINHGMTRKDCINAEPGEVIELTKEKATLGGTVPHGTMLVDNTGALVSGVVVKDRLMLAEEGLVVVLLTVDRKSGQLMTSPDIISRGFIYMRDNEELMNTFRAELRRTVLQRFKRVDLERFKAELKDHITYFLYEHTQRSPIVIPVVNVVGSKGELNEQAAKRAELRGQG